MKRLIILFCILLSLSSTRQVMAQNSVPFQWSQAMLTAIRNDFARPPMTARNLFHFSLAMYDAWAAYDSVASTVFLGKTFNGFFCPYNGIVQPADIESARNAAMSFAAYRIIRNRYINSPGWNSVTNNMLNTLMGEMGYDVNFTSADYSGGDPKALGNYIAARIISYGNTDGSNQLANYANQYYVPSNPALFPTLPGTSGIVNPNRWQPLSLSVFIDQNGNLLSGAPPFMGPEWGNVKPFALADSVKSVKQRDGYNWNVYHDPGMFPQLGETGYDINDLYKWNFALVGKWASHLDTADQVMWDISPAGIGNAVLPETFQDQLQFFDFEDGGDNGTGHSINPVTGQPYAPNMVRRGDYTRVLAEFWADGPSSETPPGHWFSILNYVITDLNGNFNWEGVENLSETEFCVKAYLTLGGALHDAAISAWGIKGYYDGVRPISAIRYLAENGQSTDASLPNFNINGMPLISGFTELVQPGDPLAGANNENVNKVKMWTWKGPDYISDPATTAAGVGWILAENWYPYQRPTFVSPPFAGYVSGHSTYSRTGAEVMTAITGSEYFPGGMGVFDAPMNEYLVFEEGPSQTVELQWATYRDAADQCSLSRIWGGIHPPMDDIAGRKIGMKLAAHAVTKADQYWIDTAPKIIAFNSNPFVNDFAVGAGYAISVTFDQPMDMTSDPGLFFTSNDLSGTLEWNDQFWLNDSVFIWNFVVTDNNEEISGIDLKIMSAMSQNGELQRIFYKNNAFVVDTKNPICLSMDVSDNLINQAFIQSESLYLEVQFDEEMIPSLSPQLSGGSLTFLNGLSPQVTWLNGHSAQLICQFPDLDEYFMNDLVQLAGFTDLAGNAMINFISDSAVDIDTQQPVVTSAEADWEMVNESSVGQNLQIKIGFNSEVDVNSTPQWSGLPLGMVPTDYSFTHPDTLLFNFNIQDENEDFSDAVSLELFGLSDIAGNVMSNGNLSDLFYWDTKQPAVQTISMWLGDGSSSINPIIIDEFNAGILSVYSLVEFDDAMDTLVVPIPSWGDAAVQASMTLNSHQWLSSTQLKLNWDVVDNDYNNFDVSLTLAGFSDGMGNGNDSTLEQHMQWVMLLLGPIPGCTDSLACNYLPFANEDDGTCWVVGAACDDGDSLTQNDMVNADCDCIGTVVSVQELRQDNWAVYPNPSSDYIYSNEPGVLEIYNALGQLVTRASVQQNEPISIIHLKSGMYWIRKGSEVRSILRVERGDGR
jgi:hypothetical protein